MSEPASETERETITTYELLERSARSALNLQREDGSFPPGRNGVYDEPETPVRTTSHWLTTLSRVYEITGNEKFGEAAKDAADYLLGEEARPYGYSFHSRNTGRKNKCDGLVGQAAPIRSLGISGRIMDRPVLVNQAKDVFLEHNFDNELGLWEAVEISGEQLSFDRTFNHQLFFASSALPLCKISNKVRNILTIFLEKLNKILKVSQNGRIHHYVNIPPGAAKRAITNTRHLKLLWHMLAMRYQFWTSNLRLKEIGYHAPILVALAQFKQKFSDHRVWTNKKIQSVFSYIETNEYKKQIETQTSGYGSMLPRIDHAIILDKCDLSGIKEIKTHVENEINEKYDPNQDMLSKNTNDPMFQSSKIYLLSELPNISINLNTV